MRASDHRKRVIAAVMGAALAVLAVITPVSGATPKSVTIIARTYFSDYYPNSFFGGPFAAAGSAVENGLICGSGHHNDTADSVHGYQSGTGIQIQNHGVFTCDDGTILLKVQIHSSFGSVQGETFTWVVEGGTGAYVDLHGSGDGFTVAGIDANDQYYHEGHMTGFLLH